MSKYRPYSQFNSTRSTLTSRRPRLQSSDATRMPPTGEIFPNWLKERKDFQDTLKNYEDIESLDICNICSKQSNLRTAVEIKALELWSRKCYFFKGIGKNAKLAICERLKSKLFQQGEEILSKGAPVEFLYFIVKGRAISEHNGTEIEIGPYNLIGERELMRSINDSSQRILSKTNVECVHLTKNDFDILAFKNRLKEQYNFKEKLKQMKCFSDLRVSKIEQLCASMIIVQYASNELIYNVKERSSFFYYIKRGSAIVDVLLTLQKKNNWPLGKKLRETLVTEEKYSRTIKEFNTGEIFGERELVLNLLRETKAVAKTDRTVLYLFGKEEFNEILNSKEREQLLNFNDRRLASPEVAKKLKNQIAQYKLKFAALMEASDIKRVKRGRALWDESISMRKDNYAKELIFRHTQDMNFILKDKTYSVSLSPNNQSLYSERNS